MSFKHELGANECLSRTAPYCFDLSRKDAMGAKAVRCLPGASNAVLRRPGLSGLAVRSLPEPFEAVLSRLHNQKNVWCRNAICDNDSSLCCQTTSAAFLNCPELYRAVPNCTELYQTVPNCFELSRTVPNCPELSQTVPN